MLILIGAFGPDRKYYKGENQMSSERDFLRIRNCKKCGKSHKYPLIVERSFFIKKITASLNNDDEGHKEYFTRLFTCPEKNENFQARFWIWVNSDEEIDSLSVLKAVTDDEDNNDY